MNKVKNPLVFLLKLISLKQVLSKKKTKIYYFFLENLKEINLR